MARQIIEISGFPCRQCGKTKFFQDTSVYEGKLLIFWDCVHCRLKIVSDPYANPIDPAIDELKSAIEMCQRSGSKEEALLVLKARLQGLKQRRKAYED